MALNEVSAPDFEQLVHRFYEPLYRFALSLARNETEACDLTQETFYLWAAKGHQLRDRSRVKTWLFTTLYRAFLGSRRRETRFPHYDLESAGRELPVISPGVVRQMDGHALMELVREIDEIYRVPLTLFYLEELSYAEIAETLDIPIGTVMSRLARGKAMLRKLLKLNAAGQENKIVPLSGASEIKREINE